MMRLIDVLFPQCYMHPGSMSGMDGQLLHHKLISNALTLGVMDLALRHCRSHHHHDARKQGIPAGTMRWPNVDPMLVHRLRRWPNIGSTLCQRIVPAGKVHIC